MSEIPSIASSEKSQYISSAAHEIYNSLTPVNMAIDMILSESVGDVVPEQKDFLLKAKTHLDRVSRLIGNIRTISKSELEDTALNVEPKDLKVIFENVLKRESFIVKDDRFKIIKSFSEHFPVVRVDQEKISLVISNLIYFIYSYADFGEVVISAQQIQEQSSVRVSFVFTSQNLKGIDLNQVFERFGYQSKASQQRIRSTGLELAVCKIIVEQHQGKISIEEKAGNFQLIFTLPIE